MIQRKALAVTIFGMLAISLWADPPAALTWQDWVKEGFTHRQAGHIDQAQSAFEKAVSLNPRALEAQFMLGLIYESKNLKQEALRAWQQVQSLATNPEQRHMAKSHIHHLSQ